MKLMPWSLAFATIRFEVASSVAPPNIMVPRQSGEIFTPLRPRLRYSISSPGERREALRLPSYAGLTGPQDENIKGTHSHGEAFAHGQKARRDRARPVRRSRAEDG